MIIPPAYGRLIWSQSSTPVRETELELLAREARAARRAARRANRDVPAAAGRRPGRRTLRARLSALPVR